MIGLKELAFLAVVVLCDYWNPSMLDEHLGDLRAHHGRGVRFLFLMAGNPGRIVSPVMNMCLYAASVSGPMISRPPRMRSSARTMEIPVKV